MTNLVNERPAYDFGADLRGNAYLCAVGRWAIDDPDSLLIPQRYVCRGLSREELLFGIQSAKAEFV